MNVSEAMTILGLEQGYSKEDLKKVYRKKARTYHPDIAGKGTEEKFKKIVSAYELLLSSGLNHAKTILTHVSIFSIKKL